MIGTTKSDAQEKKSLPIKSGRKIPPKSPNNLLQKGTIRTNKKAGLKQFQELSNMNGEMDLGSDISIRPLIAKQLMILLRMASEMTQLFQSKGITKVLSKEG